MRGYTFGRRTFGVLVLAALTVGLEVGCKAEPSVFGTWESTGSEKARITFKPDMTYEMAILRFGDTPFVTGRFKRLENSLTFTDNKVSVPGDGLFGGALGGAMSKGMSKESKFTLSWKTGDEIILDGDGIVSGAFKRVGVESQ